MKAIQTENTGNLFLDKLDSGHFRLWVGGADRELFLNTETKGWVLRVVAKAQNGETFTSNNGNQFVEVRKNGTLFFWVGGADREFSVRSTDLNWLKDKLSK